MSDEGKVDSRAGQARASHYTALGISEEINLLDYWRILWKSKIMIALITIASTGIAVLLAVLATPVYRAELLMTPAGEEDAPGGGVLGGLASQYGGLASLAGVNLGNARSGVTEFIATLRSRIFIQRFIEDNQLMPLLFADRWDAEHQQWRLEPGEEAPTLRDGTRALLDAQAVRMDNTTGLVTMTIDWTDRELASKWANLLVDRINALSRENAISQAEESIRYLKLELEKTALQELRQAIYRMIEAEIQTIMLANVRDEYAFKVIDPAPTLGEEDRIRPQRSLMVMIGFLMGLFAGIFLALVRASIVRATVIEQP